MFPTLNPAAERILVLLALFFISFILPHPEAQSQSRRDIIPVLECIEYIGSGKFRANFGYDNQNKSEVTLGSDKSFTVVGNNKASAINTFKAGRQLKVFSKEFEAKQVVEWTIVLPNGKVQKVVASINSNHCNGLSGGGIIKPEPCYTFEPSGKDDSFLGPELNSLYQRYLSNAPLCSNNIYRFDSLSNEVLIEIIARSIPDKEWLFANLPDLTDKVDYGAGSKLISGFFPIAGLNKLEAYISRIAFVRPVYQPVNNVGLVTSEGDKAILGDQARSAFPGIDGSGIKVGVLSDSYSNRNDPEKAVITGDLPAGVDLVKDFPKNFFVRGNDEGMAMMQIIHDVAPGASLAFRTGFISAGDFALGITELATGSYGQSASNIIVDDITYISEPFYREGIVSSAVKKAKEQGKAYFTSAGNFGSNAFEATINGMPFTLPSGKQVYAHRFSNGTAFQKLKLAPGLTDSTYTIVLQWDEEFYSLSDQGAVNDLDIYVIDVSNGSWKGSNSYSVGKDPMEVLSFTITGSADAEIVIVNETGISPVKFKYVVFRGELSDATKLAESITAATIVGHANAMGAITIGAVNYASTPAFNGTLAPESFSSVGGTLSRMKPDFAGPDRVATAVTGFSKFAGTSAAAPHVAAAGALILHAGDVYLHHRFSRDSLYALLKKGSLRQSPGFDYQLGYGLAQAYPSIMAFAMPRPIITGWVVTPVDAIIGKQTITLEIIGDHFTEYSKVFFGSQELQVQGFHDGRIVVSINPFIGNPYLVVFNPPSTPGATDGGYSNKILLIKKETITLSIGDSTYHKKYAAPLPQFVVTVTGLPIGVSADSVGLTNIDFIIGKNTRATDFNSLASVGRYQLSADTSMISSVLKELYNYVFIDTSYLMIDPLEVTVRPKDMVVTYGQRIPAVAYDYSYSSEIKDPAAFSAKLAWDHRYNDFLAERLVDSVLINVDTVSTNARLLANSRLLANMFVSGNLLTNSRPLANGYMLSIKDYQLDSIELNQGSQIFNSRTLANSRVLANARILANSRPLANDYPYEWLVGSDTAALANTIEYFMVNARLLANSRVLANGQEDNSIVVLNDSTDVLGTGTGISDIYTVNFITGYDVASSPHFISPAALLSGNYAVTYEPGLLTIEPAPLNLYVKDVVIDFGQEPIFDAIISGLINTGSVYTDTKASVISKINYVLDRPLTEPGIYTISATVEFLEAVNYAVSIVQGKLYVNPSGPSARAVKPILVCVEEVTGDASGYAYRANFAYKNDNATAVYVAHGDNNKLVGETGAFSGSTPVIFNPGIATFQIPFNGTRFYWSLTSIEAGKRTSIASEASSNSGRCHKLDSYSSSVTLYPNPTVGMLHMKIADYSGTDVKLEVYNEVELKYYQVKAVYNVQDGAFEIDLSTTNPGYYRLMITYGATTVTHRIVKE